MAGRHPKPRHSPNREKLLGNLRAVVGNYHARSAREAAEERLGRPVSDEEWQALEQEESERP